MAKKELPKKRVLTASSATAAPKANPKPSSSTAASEAEIKRLDREILKLINRRASVTSKYYQSLPNPHKSLFAPMADDELSELIDKSNPGPLPAVAARAVFREIVSGSKSIVKTLRIAYLGPAYSFTHLAAIERFGSSASFIPVNNI